MEREKKKEVYVITWKYLGDEMNKDVNVMVFDGDHFDEAVKLYDWITNLEDINVLCTDEDDVIKLDFVKFVKREVK